MFTQRKNRILAVLSVCMFLSVAGFIGVVPHSVVHAAVGDQVQVVFSNEAKSYKWSVQPNLTFTTPDTSTITTINVNPYKKYQQYLGIGSSFDESSVYNFNRMSPANKTAVLKLLVDPVNGAGMNLWRVCLGTSDYTGRTPYSYDDMPAGQTDTSLSNFSIQKDKDYGIIQTLQEAKNYNPDFKIFGSVWSPPGWMKDSGQLEGGANKTGNILDQYFPVLAEYFRKTINAYAAEGVPLYGITFQNEPGINTNYPMCHYTVQQQIDFFKILKANFKDSSKAGGVLSTKVWIHDFNPLDWTQNNVQAMYDDPQVLSDSDGTAFHDYWGEPAIMSDEHNKHPNKDILLTEHSNWGTAGMDRVIQYFRNWAVSYDQWVTCLDSNHNPKSPWIDYTPGNTMVINNATDGNSITYSAELYLMGQFGRYIKPGACRIDTNNGTSATVTNVAYQNPDGSIVVVVVNQNPKAMKFKILYDDAQITASIPSGTVATYKWNTQPPVATPVITPGSAIYPAAQNISVSISTVTSGATIRYTTDGSDPTPTSTVYTGPVTVNVNTTGAVTVKAKGYKTGMAGSDIAVAAYAVQSPATPAFSIPPGTYFSAQSVSISCATQGATIRYTTDGTTPTASSPIYSGPISVSSTMTINAVASKSGMSDSPIASGTFTIKAPAPIPGKIEMENYDYMSGIQAVSAARFTYIGYFDPGDWVDYVVNVGSAGTHSVDFRIASATTNGVFEIRVVNADGTTTTIGPVVTVPNTGGWETFQTLATSVNFASAGVQRLRIYAIGKEFNTDYMNFR